MTEKVCKKILNCHTDVNSNSNIFHIQIPKPWIGHCKKAKSCKDGRKNCAQDQKNIAEISCNYFKF